MDNLEPDQITDRLILYVYEINLLIRYASACGIEVHVDTVDREAVTEFIVRTSEHDHGREDLR